MPVRIRLALHGCTNRPFYHIVVAPSKAPRNGRHLEQVFVFSGLRMRISVGHTAVLGQEFLSLLYQKVMFLWFTVLSII